MTNKIVLENLKHRPMRTLLSVLLIGIPATLILSLVGVSQGMSEDAQRRNRSIGAEIVVRAGNAQNAVGFSASSLSEKFVRALEQQPHVKLAVGIISHSIDFPVTMTGVDLSQFDKMTGGFQYLQGGPLRGPYDVLVDEPYARQHKMHVGDIYDQLSQKWHVVGIIAPGKLADFAVLRTDPRRVAPAAIKDIVVDATYVGGARVWQAPAGGLAVRIHMPDTFYGDGDEQENLARER